MKVEFVLNKGWNEHVREVVEYEDCTTDEQLDEDYMAWLCEQVDGYWNKVED